MNPENSAICPLLEGGNGKTGRAEKPGASVDRAKRYQGYGHLIRETRGADANFGFVYFVGPMAGPIKIGFTRDLESRLSRLRAFSPQPLIVWAILEGTTLCESGLHRKLAAERLHGEWFKLSRATVAEIRLARQLTEHGHLAAKARDIAPALHAAAQPGYDWSACA